MRKFYEWIVNHPKSVITAFGAAAILCVFLKNMVAVDYDINDYLPEDAASTVALDLMEEEFEGGIPNARVMIRNVTIPQALEYKERLEQVDGVTDVTWLDDAVDIRVPLGTIDTKTLETYYKDDAALFTVTISEDQRISAVEDIRKMIGDDNAMTGSAVSTAVATTSTVAEVMKISIFAVAFVLMVLLLTTPSWLEPLVVLGGLGIAIVINSGSNLIFGEISFVTNAAGNILQLAVSLDYSVFLIHRFEECRLEYTDVKTAMVEALTKSTTSILSSGLTTVIGFLALVLMQFRIGPDLGLALAKGVALSLITVFVFMPDLVLVTYHLLDRTRHRPLVPSCHKFGKLVQKLMIPMGTKVVYIERLVWQDNEPIAIDKIYIEDARFPDFITTLSKDRSFYQVMDECYHIRPNHSVLEIDGKAAQSHSADTLKCNVGDPLFSIHKISYDQDGKPIHYSLTTVRCDRVTYVVSTNDSTVMDEKIKSN